MNEEAIFRSADMSYNLMYVPLDIARDVVLALGEQGMMHFLDLNVGVSAFQRHFVKELRRIDNTERQLRHLREVIERTGSLPVKYDPLLVLSQTSQTNLDQLIRNIDLLDSRVSQLETSRLELVGRHARLIEKRYILQGSREFFDSGIRSQARLSIDRVDDAPLLLEQESLEAGYQLSNLQELDLNYVVGSIPTSKVAILNKILWRSLRGNLYMNHTPMDEPIDDAKGGSVEKSVFIVFTHGQLLLSRVRKIAESLDGHVYRDITSNAEIYEQELAELNLQVRDLSQVMDSTSQQLSAELIIISEHLQTWQALMRREKRIYSTMNLFRMGSRGMVGEGWIPTSDVPEVQNVLRDIEGSGNAVLTPQSPKGSPPTFHRTNKFTSGFQAIVDAYGVASYKEVNPGLPTVVTFPFMFAIMFGDLGHGFILFCVALVLVLKEKKLALQKKDEIFAMAFDGRYILLLMGIFSMFTGLMYNDVFSKSMTLFPSGWKWPEPDILGQTLVAENTGFVYPFGLDWAWHGTENNLLFTNSYKMKLSILMGYCHMTYSFMFSLVNYRHKRSMVDVIGNFLPSLLFMQPIFGYLSFTIVYKWCFDWNKLELPAPGLLNMLINMFLSPGHVEYELFRGQAIVQVMFLLIALISVPWLLLYKPMTLRHLNNRAIRLGYTSVHEQEAAQLVQEQEDSAGDDLIISHAHDKDESGEGHEYNFGDVMIHQVIHAIEFCLNCVSHTASYLRLWALSLAHAQLSSVLWSMTIANAFSSENPGSVVQVIKVVLLFGLWFVLTVAILVMMEGTSAMLHSLRLHWVEAMSKYFEGEGHPYEPFNFQGINDDETAF